VQQLIREKFQQVSIYGYSVITDLQIKAEYKAATKLGQNVYNVDIAVVFDTSPVGGLCSGLSSLYSRVTLQPVMA